LQDTSEPVPFDPNADKESLIKAQIIRVIDHPEINGNGRGAWIVQGKFQDCFFFCLNQEATTLSQVRRLINGELPLPNAAFFGKIDNGIENISSLLVKITMGTSSKQTNPFDSNVASNWRANVISALTDARKSGTTRIRINPKNNAIFQFNADGRTGIVNNEPFEKK